MTNFLATRRAMLIASSVAALTIAGAPTAAAARTPTVVRGTASPTVEVYATGFNNPRGLKFGPDGALYVAEGGPGGGTSTVGKCTQVPAPVGPYTGAARGGRISRVDSSGARTTVTDRFPSSQTSPQQGNLVSGVSDIAFIGSTLYALTAGSGCSHGVPNTVNGIYRLSANGNPVLVANLSAYEMAHPVVDPDPDDFEPDGTWYSMVALGQTLYAVEPNQGQIDRITTTGAISRVIDTSATLGHAQPTAITNHVGVLYVGNLGSFPIVPGSSKIFQVTRTGALTTVASGFTTILGVTFDNLGRLYVLENTTTAGFPTPGKGDIVRLTGSRRDLIVSGLNLPTAMTYGPGNSLYVSVWGFGPPPSLPNGPGQVLRIRLGD